ncbi:hypothetical protein AX15_003942 [Amanita polypyramis BW_CC]|nr:hypothetical protein AX15_003942 [Amanita polypyramis BW_CC]
MDYQSPRRADTPEPASIQGRRNAGLHLLDEDGAISDKLEACLKHIFAKYCNPPVEKRESFNGQLLTPPPSAYLSPQGLDEWARDTNGVPFSKETKEELIEFLDVTDDGGLTLKGFFQIYQLQTENDEEETWRDLSTHGFDRRLKLVTTRREEEVEGHERII